MKFQRSRLTDLPLFVLQVVWEQQGRWCTVCVPSIKGKLDSRSCWWGVASLLRASLWSPSFSGSSPQRLNPGSEELGAPLLVITPNLDQPMDWSYLSGWDGNNVSSLVVILCNGITIYCCLIMVIFCSNKSIIRSPPAVSTFFLFCLIYICHNCIEIKCSISFSYLPDSTCCQ